MALTALFVCACCFVSNLPADAEQTAEPKDTTANRMSQASQSQPVPAAAWPTARPLKFARLSTEQGLSQNTVLCALQDRQGFMWFGTQDGLNRFDGYGFTIYRHDDADPGSLRDNYILSLYEDRAGVLWVGTMKGVTRFDPQTGACRNYDRTDGLFGNEIGHGAYYQNRQGALFFGGSEGFSAFQPEQIQDDLTPPPIVLTACRRYNTDAAEGVALLG